MGFLIARAFDSKAVIANFVDVGDLDTGCLTLLLVGFVVVSLILSSGDGKDANFQALFTGVAYYVAASLNTHLNPALTFGGSLINTFHGNSDAFHGRWDDHWVHWIMPLAAGALAALFNKFRNRDGASG